ncbi:MAG: hypothetical protein OSB21_10655 [Myxococcota bacterium]|nr:hypothetical protein [Myxococcota bacterium]
MRLLALSVLFAGCAPEATIEIIKPPFLVDSYPGNGSLLPNDQVSPLLLSFSKAISNAASANAHITLEALNESGDASGVVALNACSGDAAGLVLECAINGNLDFATRYRITLGTGLSFVSGEQLLKAHQRWFQTLPE